MSIKRDIINAGINGIRLSGREVARVARDKRSVTMRHIWPENTDGRAWAAIKSAAMDLAEEVACKTGRPVELYAKEGHTIEQARPRNCR